MSVSLRAGLKRLAGHRSAAALRRSRIAVRRARTTVRERGRRHPALTRPASESWGFDRGTPVGRYYIEKFLERHGASNRGPGDIRGHVLEIGDDEYSRRFGRRGRAARDGGVERIDIMDIDPENKQATIVGDLSDPDALPAATFDCIVCTEVLMLIYDVRAAAANLYRALRPGGVLLITVAGINKVCRPDIDNDADFWRFTRVSLRRLLEESFPAEGIEIETHGNVLAASAFLYGLAAEELSAAELDEHDSDYEVTIAARAVKPSAS